MAKKLTINTNNGSLADGFFSAETIRQAEGSTEKTQAKESPTVSAKKCGRPKKEKKKSQYTLTMDPDLYQMLKTKAAEKQKSFSQLVTDIIIEHLELDEN